jgi:cytosine/adenosine deaminase-related metal-dependent hydrolase
MIITSSILIGYKGGNAPVKEWAIVINKGIIQAVGPLQRISRQFPRHRVLKLQNTVLMPGLINVHTHLELPELLNTIRSKAFSDWILNLIKIKKGLTIEDYTASATKNITTIIQTGTTTIGEICTQGVSPEFIRKSGLRAVVFYEIIKMGPRVRNQESRIRLPRGSNSALIKYGLSPHSPYTVSESILRDISLLSSKKNMRIAMHIAESKDELKLFLRKKSGLERLYNIASWNLDWAPQIDSSVKYLDCIGLLSNNLLAVHAVQITNKDIALIKRKVVSIAHCPRSNKETRVGRMPLSKLLNAGITVGLGTDSLASTPSLNMWDEMRFAYHLHHRDGIAAKDIFKLATIGGAKALGLFKEIGTLEPGKKADIIAVPIPSHDSGDLFVDLLRETNSCLLSMVNGKLLYRADQLNLRKSS